MIFLFADIHDSDCLINNPLFSEAGLVPCDMCDEVTEVEAVENMKSFKDAYYNTAQPALLSVSKIVYMWFH